MQHLKAAPLSITLVLVCLLFLGVAHAQSVSINEACVDETLTQRIPLDSGGQLKISIKCEGDWSVQLLVQVAESGGNIMTFFQYLILHSSAGTPDSGEISFLNENLNIVERKFTMTSVNGDNISVKFNFD